jgi:hypothetical protein
MALDAERELTQWTAGIDVNRSFIWGMAAVRLAGSDVVHSSGSPALRRPSYRFEIGGTQT